MTEAPDFKLDEIDSATEPRKSVEELQVETDAEAERQEARKDAKQSEPATEINKAQGTREARKNGNDIVLKWLISCGIKHDDDFFVKFKAVMEEQHGQKPENLDETAELLNLMPELFKQVDFKIAELGKDTARYGKIAEKRVEIIKGVCEPVLNGHLTAEDAFALVSGIEIVSINDPSKQELFKEMNIRSGYEGVMFCDTKHHKIYIFDETLVDNYLSFPDGLKIKHMVTHEMSHNVVEASVKYNKTLVAKAKEIVEAAKDLKDSQSIHICNSLMGAENAKTDFDKHFADHLSKSPEYSAMPEEQKDQFKELEEKKFINDRKIQSAVEILTDYTAIYLQSDGSFEDFVMKCTKISDETNLLQYFEGKVDVKQIKKINKEKDAAKRAELIAKTGGKIEPLVKIYKTFYDEIKNQMTSSKGKFAELTASESDDEDPFGEYSGGGYMDGPAGFGQKEAGGQKAGGGESLWKEFGALVAAIAGEVPNVS